MHAYLGSSLSPLISVLTRGGPCEIFRHVCFLKRESSLDGDEVLMDSIPLSILDLRAGIGRVGPIDGWMRQFGYVEVQ